MSDMAQDENVTAALLVIGDEILSGRTKDVNIGAVADFCTDLGIDLHEVRVVADIIDEIVEALDVLRTRYTYVFTTGGIGGTHDDLTAEAVAKAFGVELVLDKEAEALLTTRWKHVPMTETRLKMAYVPDGATLVDNAVSAAPGFRMENVITMAGVPVIMRSMLETLATKLKGGRKLLSLTVEASVGEGDLGGPLGEIQARYEDVKLGSYPQMGKDKVFTQLVARSADADRLAAAVAEICAMVDKVHVARGVETDPVQPVETLPDSKM